MEEWQTTEHAVIRCVVALVLLSVWTWRVNRPTSFRGAKARTMLEEFKAYGLARGTAYLVGGIKVTIALCFLSGFWFPVLIRPAAAILVFLMSMAVFYHLKVEDKLRKALPAYLILFFSTYLMIS